MTIRDRLMTVMRWAVVAWVVYCAYQMIRWRQFDEPALVAGWYWIGSVWGCLLSFMGTTRLRRIDWGARMALFAPVGFLLPVMFRSILLKGKFDSGPEWMWLCLSFFFDVVLLPWNWKLPRVRTSILFGMALLVGVAAVALAQNTNEASPVLFVGTLILVTVALFRSDGGTPRLTGLIPSVSLLIAIDMSHLIAMALRKDAAIEWGLMHVVRMFAAAIVGWRLACPQQDKTIDSTHNAVSWPSRLPMRAIRVVVWLGIAAWTSLICWLIPRCVAIQTEYGRVRPWRVYLIGDSDIPRFINRHQLLSLIWKAGMSVSDDLYLDQAEIQIPEVVFSLRELKHFHARGTVSDRTLKSLRQFPELKSLYFSDVKGVTKSGLDALANLPKLTKLQLANLQFSFDDFVGFSSHPDLEVKLRNCSVKRHSGEESQAQCGIQVLSGLKELELSVDSDCDEELAQQLCEISCLRGLYLRSLRNVSAQTMKRLFSMPSLRHSYFRVDDVGESESLSQIGDWAVSLPYSSFLKLNWASVPLTDSDIAALRTIVDRLSELHSVTKSRLPEEERPGNSVHVAVNCIVDGDDRLEQLCGIRFLYTVSARVRGVTERGLRAIAVQTEWHSGEFQFDFRLSPRPAHLWADHIPQDCDWQIIVTPESIQTDEDAAALRRLQPSESLQRTGRDKTLHVVCDTPSIEVLRHLKQFAIPASIVIDLSERALTMDQLTRIVEEIPTNSHSVDLRLPHHLHFTDNDTRPLVALARIDGLRLEINLDDSASFALAGLNGLYELDIRESKIGPRGFAELEKCRNLTSLRFQPTMQTRELMRWIGTCSHSLRIVEVVRPSMEGEFLDLCRTLGEEWDKNTRGGTLRMVLMDIAPSPKVVNSLNGSARRVRFLDCDGHSDFRHPVFENPTRVTNSKD